MGLLVTMDIPQPESIQFISMPRPELRIDTENIQKRIADPSFVGVDARIAEEHMQVRIPDSILHRSEWGIGTNDATFLSHYDLKNEFESQRIRPEKDDVCYCPSGIFTSHKFIRYRLAGYDELRLCDGLIIDWAKCKSPIW